MQQMSISLSEKFLKPSLHVVYFMNAFRSFPSAMLIRFTSRGGLGHCPHVRDCNAIQAELSTKITEGWQMGEFGEFH